MLQDRDTDDRLVHYRCVAPAHATLVASRSSLLMHNGRFAYCPTGSLDRDHVWKQTGGIRPARLRAQEAEGDDRLLAVIAAAEDLYAQLRDTVGATTFHLEIARPGAPFTIDLGERWPLIGRALLEIPLSDAAGPIGWLRIGDEHGDGYGEAERALVSRIASAYLVVLRRWLSALN